jgi:hypothetical protein
MSVWVRIALRYLAAILVAHGWLVPEDARLIAGDPELAAALEIALGVLIGVCVETAYLIARRAGWRT